MGERKELLTCVFFLFVVIFEALSKSTSLEILFLVWTSLLTLNFIFFRCAGSSTTISIIIHRNNDDRSGFLLKYVKNKRNPTSKLVTNIYDYSIFIDINVEQDKL